ncbi:DUF4142 domain-containing protein [Acetobacter musti]|uniref:DUF4142 domain-containing protein n=1 Tax=Acetobacter musti TaxID=864732 RepID=A0ABX0JIV1_9PROT|nr:DUF4142 domain-containing protein [Acetobacter musti]NHN83396.1 DUF4142 domain-containing protein [Acetobacter musti]
MNVTSKITTLAALSVLAACSSITGPGAPPAPPPPSALNATDSSFVQKASEMNLMEIALGSAAATNASASGVKSFAATLVTDHTAQQNRLSAIATGHGVTLATDPSADDKKTVTTISALKGSAFDQAFLSQVVTDHKAALPVMTAEHTASTDIDLKSYAEDNSANIQKHLSAAEALTGSGHSGKSHRHTRRR